jgi:dihydroorotase
MPLKDLDGLVVPATADFHVHLRDGTMMEAVVPTIRSGGVNTVYVMASRCAHICRLFLTSISKPNLVPPITTVAHALEYKKKLEALEPKVNYLMSLYLHPDIKPETIIEAKKAGITGVKSYPAGKP